MSHNLVNKFGFHPPSSIHQTKNLGRPNNSSKHLGWLTSSTKIWVATSHPTSPFNHVPHEGSQMRARGSHLVRGDCAGVHARGGEAHGPPHAHPQGGPTARAGVWRAIAQHAAHDAGASIIRMISPNICHLTFCNNFDHSSY
jgi:hypothetical protein